MEGFNFRATAEYVTDPTDTQYVNGTDPTYLYDYTNDGVTFGLSTVSGLQARNRSTSVPKLAGTVFVYNTADQVTFRVDLESTGNHDIYIAIGDYEYSNDNPYVQFLDDSTEIDVIDYSGTLDGQHFIDAEGTEHTSAANWVSNNVAITHNFTSTIFYVKFGQPGTATSGSSAIAHLAIDPTAATGSIIPQIMLQHNHFNGGT